MIRLLPALVLIFKVWLVADSIKRREACYWPWIIFFVPLGGVVYFFLVKIDDYNLARAGISFEGHRRWKTCATTFSKPPAWLTASPSPRGSTTRVTMKKR